MNVAEWILVVILSVTLFVFLVVGIVLIVKLIILAGEAKKIVLTGQGIATKADDIIDNVKGMTSVGGIVKTFANRVISEQERRYANEDATRDAVEEAEREAAEAVARAEAVREAAKKSTTGRKTSTKSAGKK